jgi:hypothetical protein
MGSCVSGRAFCALSDLTCILTYSPQEGTEYALGPLKGNGGRCSHSRRGASFSWGSRLHWGPLGAGQEQARQKQNDLHNRCLSTS